MNFRDLNQMEKDYERSIKTDLAKQYKQIIAQRELEKKMQKERKAIEDKEYIQGLKNLESLEKLKSDHINRQYKQNMLELLNEERQNQRKKQ